MLFIDEFISLFYPRICLSCGVSLNTHEETICTSCLFHLPQTNFHLEKENPISIMFWGRVGITSAAAYYYYSKAGKVQNLMHHFKYKGKKEIGVYIGKLYGIELKKSHLFNGVDIIIPVPLHFIKEKKRGFNQSEMFAKGLSISMKIDYNIKILRRIVASSTQTKKSRFDRWENVKEIFEVNNQKFLEGKHILIVDDVITTGATIEACAHVLLDVPKTKVSVVAMASAVI